GLYSRAELIEAMKKRSVPELQRLYEAFNARHHAEGSQEREREPEGEKKRPELERYKKDLPPEEVADFLIGPLGGRQQGVFEVQSARQIGIRTYSGEIVRFWRTREVPARTPSFREARKKVEAAWRFQKARQLANRAALRIEKELRKKGFGANA